MENNTFKQNTLKTDNELIAEFMGGAISTGRVIFQTPPLFHNCNWDVNHLVYHRSWDWLMPVVEKIESLRMVHGGSNLTFSVEIHRNGCRIYRSWTTVDHPHFGWNQTGDKLRSTYKAVVDFIKWYNSQQND